jgi:hypothetical protein
MTNIPIIVCIFRRILEKHCSVCLVLEIRKLEQEVRAHVKLAGPQGFDVLLQLKMGLKFCISFMGWGPTPRTITNQ